MLSTYGIDHATQAGFPLCRNRRAASGVNIDKFRTLKPHQQCARCRAKLEKMDQVAAKRSAMVAA